VPAASGLAVENLHVPHDFSRPFRRAARRNETADRPDSPSEQKAEAQAAATGHSDSALFYRTQETQGNHERLLTA